MEIIIPQENELYKEYINRILNSRENKKNKENYQELHHIIPKCMEGTDDKENLVYLYAQEHYYAHKLLSYENPNNDKLQTAYWAMSGLLNKNRKDNISIDINDLADARERMALSKIGLPKSEDIIRLISEHHADVSGEKKSNVWKNAYS